MSAAPVSRSSALPEIPLPSRRSVDAGEREQSFTLPEEPTDRARPRREDDRSASRESVETRDQPKSDDAARRTVAADTKAPTRADDAGKERKAAAAPEPSGKGKAEPVTAEAATKDAKAADGKQAETAVGEKPGKGEAAEESKAAPTAALDAAPVIDQSKPEAAVVPVVAPQPVPTPVVAAEFLALAALTPPSSEPAQLDGAAIPQEGKPEAQAVAASSAAAVAGPEVAGQAVAGILAVPAPAAPGKTDGQADAGADAVAADAKAGSVPQLSPATVPAKAEPVAGETMPQGDAKAPDGQALPKDAAETGKAATVAADGDIKVAEAASARQAPQPAAADDAAPTTGIQPASPPVSPQLILAAAPLSLIVPQAPLTELDAAAQATAHAQAEAAHKAVSGETGRATPLHVVPVEIGARALAGNKRFDIRLDPAELGRIDVSLEISDKGEVSARLTVDRVETLHMLQRDARTLERAFEQAGLKPSEGGIDMSLRDSGDQQAGARQQRQDDEAPRGRRAWVQVSEDSALVTDVASQPRNASRLGGVDLSI